MKLDEIKSLCKEDMMDKFYSVEEVALMTGLTSRTIRTYIKEGVLRGKKVGVQWRFTEEEVKELFKDKQVERQVADAKNQLVVDFLNKRQGKDNRSCMIVDCPVMSETVEVELRDKLMEFINNYEWGAEFQFSYQLFEEENTARFIISGALKEISKVIDIINEFAENQLGRE